MASGAAERFQAGSPGLAAVTQPNPQPAGEALSRRASGSPNVRTAGSVIDLRGASPVLDLAPASPSARPRLDLRAREIRAKRAFDIAFALGALGIAGIPMALLSGAIRLASPGPALFRQTRVGRNGVHFVCLKFRTMRGDADDMLQDLLDADPELAAEFEAGYKLRQDPRITSFGGLLRRTSLDELPQLINVLRGEMSVVGPRPLQPDETVRYGEAIDQVLTVRPGLTGLWQVSGRNDLAYDERVEIDHRYASSWRFVDDLRILFRTVPILAFPGRNGAY